MDGNIKVILAIAEMEALIDNATMLH